MPFTSLWHRLRASLVGGHRPRQPDTELDEEMRFHVEQLAARYRREGLPPAEAERRARVTFGGTERFKEEVRDARGGRWRDDLARDVRHALRGLRRTPGFTAVAVLSLALGIGANTAVFSVLQAVLLRALPYASADRLLSIGVLDDGEARPSTLSPADALALEDARSFEQVGVYASHLGGFTYVAGDEAVQVTGADVSASLFPTLGVQPRYGRLPAAADGADGAPLVVVVSHAFWQQQLGGDPAAVGRTIRLDDRSRTVIGVMPPDFRLPGARAHDVWAVAPRETPEARAPFYLRAVGRLAPGVTAAQAAAELDVVAASVKRRWPDSPPQWRFAVTDLREHIVADARVVVLALYGAVALVLLVAVANVANLFLARATARSAELAVRTALGAGRLRLARQLLTESGLVAIAGGALGLGLAAVGVRLLATGLANELPRAGEVRLDGGVLLFTLAVSLLVGLLVGLAPALHLPVRALGQQLRDGSRGSDGAARGRLRGALVIAEIALTLTVLVVAALIGGSLQRLQQVDPGFSARRVLVTQLTIPEARYAEEAQRGAYYDEVLARVRALPGVSVASVSMAVPPHRLVMSNPFTPQGLTLASGQRAPVADQLLVSPGYFRTLGMPVRLGRDFTDADRQGAPAVVIVNEALARRYFPGQEAVGGWLQLGDPDPGTPRLTIVGVVPDVHYTGLHTAPAPTIYVPYAQNRWWPSMYLLVQTHGEPGALVPDVRRAVTGVDPLVPMRDVLTIDRLLGESVAEPRFRALLLGAFALITLLLAVAGIYGVLSYTVAQRRRETAIRMALGAQRADVVRLVLRDGMRLAAAGLAIGLALAALATRPLGALLFELPPLHLPTYAAAALLLGAFALLACLVPARRATRADPMVAMRSE